MMRHFILSLFLLSSAAAWAQPWGPFIVSDESGVRNPQICLRNSDTADVFYQIADTVYHSVVELESGTVTPDPNEFFLEGTGWRRSLCDVVSTADGWAALVYDTTPQVHRTHLFEGRDSVANLRQISSGSFWDGNMQHSGVRDYGFALAPRAAGGCFAVWQNTWIYYNPWPPPGWSEAGSGVTMYASDADWPHNPLLEDAFEGCGSSGGDEQTALHHVSDDSVLILEFCGSSIQVLSIVDRGMGFGIGLNRGLYCNVQMVKCLFARAGNIVVVSRSFGSTPARVLRIDNLSSCTELRTLSDEPIAGASDRDWGLAWLAWHGPGILLYRADTTGAEYLTPGIVHWPETTTIHEAAIAVSHNGRIAAIWTEGAPGSTDASTLRIKSLNWDTPLGASDRDFIPHPSSFILSAYPNPFNASTQLSFDLPRAGKATLQVFDLLGREVARLIDGSTEAGMHRITWNADSQPSGLYFARLTTPDGIRTIKLCLTK